MEENYVDELDKNLKSIVADNELIKKDNAEMKEQLRSIEARAGRLMAKAAAGDEPVGITAGIAAAMRNPENVEQLEKYRKKQIKEFTMELDFKADMNFGTNFSTGTTAVSQNRPGIIGPAPKLNHLRDFIPGQVNDTLNYVYTKETSVSGAPSFTPESSIKPSVSFNLQQVTATTQYLAETAVISNQLLFDIAGIQSYLQERLIQLLLDQEDLAIIGGNGISPNYGGLHLAGNNTAGTSGSAVAIEEILDSISQLAALNRRPSLVIMNPLDYFKLLQNKASTAGLYSLPPSVVFQADSSLTIAGVKTIWNTAQVSGKFDVLDTTGVLLVMREPARVTFYTDSTMAAKNSTFILGELRETFCVYASTYDIFKTI